jgi:hypothetical protein
LNAILKAHVYYKVYIGDIDDPRLLDVNFWKEWSPQAPDGMKPGTIELEAVYTESLLVLFSVPVEIWVRSDVAARGQLHLISSIVYLLMLYTRLLHNIID